MKTEFPPDPMNIPSEEDLDDGKILDGAQEIRQDTVALKDQIKSLREKLSNSPDPKAAAKEMAGLARKGAQELGAKARRIAQAAQNRKAAQTKTQNPEPSADKPEGKPEVVSSKNIEPTEQQTKKVEETSNNLAPKISVIETSNSPETLLPKTDLDTILFKKPREILLPGHMSQQELETDLALLHSHRNVIEYLRSKGGHGSIVLVDEDNNPIRDKGVAIQRLLDETEKRIDLENRTLEKNKRGGNHFPKLVMDNLPHEEEPAKEIRLGTSRMTRITPEQVGAAEKYKEGKQEQGVEKNPSQESAPSNRLTSNELIAALNGLHTDKEMQKYIESLGGYDNILIVDPTSQKVLKGMVKMKSEIFTAADERIQSEQKQSTENPSPKQSQEADTNSERSTEAGIPQRMTQAELEAYMAQIHTKADLYRFSDAVGGITNIVLTDSGTNDSIAVDMDKRRDDILALTIDRVAPQPTKTEAGPGKKRKEFRNFSLSEKLAFEEEHEKKQDYHRAPDETVYGGDVMRKNRESHWLSAEEPKSTSRTSPEAPGTIPEAIVVPEELPPISREAIDSFTDIKELKEYLSAQTSIREGRGAITGSHLVRIIEAVELGYPNPIEAITREYGLRQKVWELIIAESGEEPYSLDYAEEQTQEANEHIRIKQHLDVVEEDDPLAPFIYRPDIDDPEYIEPKSFTSNSSKESISMNFPSPTIQESFFGRLFRNIRNLFKKKS